jgi:hypothetical protein
MTNDQRRTEAATEDQVAMDRTAEAERDAEKRADNAEDSRRQRALDDGELGGEA